MSTIEFIPSEQDITREVNSKASGRKSFNGIRPSDDLDDYERDLSRRIRIHTHSATGPSITGPSITGPSITGPSITGPSITGPSITGPSITGPHSATGSK